jgi:maleylacetate reductase
LNPNLPLVTRTDGDTLIVLGPGSTDRLGSYLETIGARRAYLISGRSLAEGAAGIRVRKALAGRLVGAYAGVRPHVPIDTADEVADEATAVQADVLVGLGGGSPIGTAKAASFRMQGATTQDASRATCRVVAIPTTYAGSEVTSTFGTSDRSTGRKEVIRDSRIRPRLALYDPELAVETPPDLTASTGVNALAHCVEGLYSRDAREVERAVAVRSATLLVKHLPASVLRPDDVIQRYRLFEASMDAGLVLERAGMGVHHGLCHVLGGRYNAPHGVLNAIVLPHAMRFNLPVAAAAYRRLAPALGLGGDGAESNGIPEQVCDTTTDFIRQFRLPSRLRDLGIPQADLQSLAEEAMKSSAVRHNPRTLRGPADALEILEAAW